MNNLKFELSKLKYSLVNNIRNFLDLFYYLFWLSTDFSKFKKIKHSKIKSILVIYAGAIGDIYNAIGLLNRFSQLYPKIKINFLTIGKNQKFIKNPLIKLINKEESKKLIRDNKIDALITFQGWYFKDELFDYDFYKLLKKIPYRSGCDNAQINPSFLLKQIVRFPRLTRKVYSVNTNGFEDHLKSWVLI